MDPLTALREFTIRDKLDQIVRVGNEFHFGSSYSFPCSIETAYRSKTHNYTLETLVFFIKNHHHTKSTDYIRNAHNHKIPAVSFLDRKPLIDYLNGTISSSPNIQHNPPLFDDYRPENSQIHGEIDVNEPSYESGVAKDPILMIREGERPLKDREMVLECRNRDFLGVLVAATKRNEERERVESHQRKDGLVAKSRIERGGGFGDDLVGGFDAMPKTKMHLRGSKVGEGVPIILVPSAFQTLITIYNVKEFLEDGVFMTTDEKVKKMNGARPECVTVQKKFSRDRVVTAYEVRDKPGALKPEDWERVVAVFVLGKEWQFKDWPFKDHVEIFNKIIGFYMRFEDDSVESAKIVKQWNVKIISISKNKRHQDRAAALEFWDRLEEFIRSRSRS